MLPAATLVFKTIRVGFPKAPLKVFPNDQPAELDSILKASAAVGGVCYPQFLDNCRHDVWILHLLDTEPGPFWICDTDIVFWKKFEHTPDGSALAGVRVPSFYEPWTGTQYRERLHTCLMRIDPEAFRASKAKYMDSFPQEPFHPFLMFVPQQWQAERINGRVTNHFYDTLAMAWHAFGGQEFTPEQILSFDHLNCATYADLIAPSLDFDILGAHKAVYEDITKARGSWATQFKWFKEHKNKETNTAK